MTVDVSESITQTIHPAFQLLRQHHVEALDIYVSEYKHKVTGAVHYHLATNNDENVKASDNKKNHIIILPYSTDHGERPPAHGVVLTWSNFDNESI